MQTRLDRHLLSLGVVGSALTIRALSDDDIRVHRLAGRIAAVANRLPDRVFEEGALNPLRPVALQTVGRRTGISHEVRLLVWPSDAHWVATTCMGREPDWMGNLRFHPGALLEVEGPPAAVEARFLKGDEGDAALHDLRTSASPLVRGFAGILGRRSRSCVLVAFRRC